MSLTVKLKNIGIIKQAEFSLGDLTILCGENNTGKTYAAYALYSFLNSWRDFMQIPYDTSQIQRMLDSGLKANFKLEVEHLFEKAGKLYKDQLDRIFAAGEGTFQDSEISIVSENTDLEIRDYDDRIDTSQGHTLRISLKNQGRGKLEIEIGIEDKIKKQMDASAVSDVLDDFIGEAIFSDSLPRTFIISSERTGVSVFRKELDYARSHLLDEFGDAGNNKEKYQLLSKAYQRYPSPINENIDYSRQLDNIAKSKSFISKEHPEVLENFAEIVGGDYTITQNDQLYFIPKGTREKLTMVECSSTARSLLDLSFYIRHVAKKGDLLMIDEPELSLHPENQRRIARLFARLVNLGIKVFITTHSDYIVKELNTLIMLNHEKPHLKRIAEENGYQESELIKADQIKLYMAKKALVPLEEGQKRRKRAHTLVPAKIHPKFGIEVPSFDKTIDDMNRIQDEIVWGEE